MKIPNLPKLFDAGRSTNWCYGIKHAKRHDVLPWSMGALRTSLIWPVISGWMFVAWMLAEVVFALPLTLLGVARGQR